MSTHEIAEQKAPNLALVGVTTAQRNGGNDFGGTTLKPNGKLCSIAEQIIEDRVTGLTIQFEVTPDGTTQLFISGPSLPYGNRDFAFDANGKKSASGTGLAGTPKLSWLKPLS